MSTARKLGIKALTLENWKTPEVPIAFTLFTEEKWLARITAPQLIATVPENVVKLFEVARGSMAYGWFFYPLLTLAEEQLHRVQETAARERCKLAGIPIKDKSFDDLIKRLVDHEIIPADSISLWEAARHLRNHSSHPQNQMIIPPGMAVGGLEATVRQINQLFADNPDYFSSLGERVRRATGMDNHSHEFPIVAGIDVGGKKKGFHVVVLRGPTILGVKVTSDPREVVRWCSELGVTIVAVDAPCGWTRGVERKSREAEAMLAQLGYSAHATPTRERALQSSFYEWMLNGEQLYQALGADYPLFRGEYPTPRFCFETYPYLATCGYAGKRLKADDKNSDRRDIVRGAGLDDQAMRNIDYVDAAICALVACSVSIDYCIAFGSAEEGFILSPPLH